MDKEKKEFSVILGRRLKSLREKRHLTQAELGALLGKDGQQIGNWEQGRFAPSFYYIIKIARALKVPLSDVYDISEGRGGG